MIAIACQHENRRKHGKRNNQQRWKCRNCGVAFTCNEERPLGGMRTEMKDAVVVLGMLLEGMSIRACQRLTGMKRDTICDLILTVGENCDRFLESAVVGVRTQSCQIDEQWNFVLCKEKHKKQMGYGDECGDCWTWIAIDSDSKLILSHAVGHRDESTCLRLLRRLNRATEGSRMQVTTDGLAVYSNNVPYELGSRISYAQLIKSYASSQEETRYSPAKITGIEIVERFGKPDMDEVSTSYVERFNLTSRTHLKRYARLTLSHSKSARHHAAMTNLFVAWYNFCRRHETLSRQTPAMASGLTDHVWSIEELLQSAK